MKKSKIFDVLVWMAMFAITLMNIQLGVINLKLNNLKVETHYRYLLPRDGQCRIKRLKLDNAYEDRMVCNWELK